MTFGDIGAGKSNCYAMGVGSLGRRSRRKFLEDLFGCKCEAQSLGCRQSGFAHTRLQVSPEAEQELLLRFAGVGLHGVLERHSGEKQANCGLVSPRSGAQGFGQFTG
jgi:hypothetical protein